MLAQYVLKVKLYTETMEQEPNEQITLPSSLRLIQRLGQISTNASMKEHLYPAIASHEREQFSPEGFVDMIAGHIIDYADEHASGISGIFLNKMPSYITTILDKDEDKEKALDYWMTEVEKSKEIALDKERIIKQILQGDKPRKQKKREKKSLDHENRTHANNRNKHRRR